MIFSNLLHKWGRGEDWSTTQDQEDLRGCTNYRAMLHRSSASLGTFSLNACICACSDYFVVNMILIEQAIVLKIRCSTESTL